jgi:4-oxalocrotonate tautomerase
MPFVNIKVTKENGQGITVEEKKQLIEGTTKLLQEVLGKNPATTVVVIDEIDTDNYGLGGQTITEKRKEAK